MCPHVPVWIFVNGLVLFQLIGFREDSVTVLIRTGISLGRIVSREFNGGEERHTSPMIIRRRVSGMSRRITRFSREENCV